MGAKTRLRMRPSKRKYSKYSKRAAEEVRTEMHHMSEGKHPDHPIKSRKQAIAVGLSKARKKGEKVPPAPGRRAA